MDSSVIALVVACLNWAKIGREFLSVEMVEFSLCSIKSKVFNPLAFAGSVFFYLSTGTK